MATKQKEGIKMDEKQKGFGTVIAACIIVTILAAGGLGVLVVSGPVQVQEEEDLAPTAAEMRDKFIPWLAANHPEFGITSETEWTGTIVYPGMVGVSYYLFSSEDWEMGVSWHVMRPPYDWARIYLMHRITETSPSYAFEISSLDAQEEPHVIDPPESVWR
ncbi:MAG: hypothetical protein GH150_05310 [Hadesarchaea archaeon]|nr:hypothetical protein [Hadesarchaea archaeon]